jgi:nudix-type nucleoside diphosphatase (YffH/AdpP family)
MSAPETKTGAMPYRILSREMLWKGFCTLERVTFERIRADGTPYVQSFEIENHGRAAAVLPFDPITRRAVLVRQLRLPQALQGDDPMMLEVVAGLLDKGNENPEETARREALEEAGLALGRLEFAGTVRPSPGLIGEKVWIYLAEVDLSTDRVAEGGGLAHEGEDIEVVVMDLAELAAFVDRGDDLDLKSAFAVQTLRVRRPELFG